jgi:hypothetical protein
MQAVEFVQPPFRDRPRIELLSARFIADTRRVLGRNVRPLVDTDDHESARSMSTTIRSQGSKSGFPAQPLPGSGGQPVVSRERP